MNITAEQRWNTARQMRDRGATYREIGECFGISVCRAHQLVERSRQGDKDKDEWYSGLPGRARNCLSRIGCESRESVIDALRQGKIRAGRYRGGLPSLGDKTLAIIREWAGCVVHHPK